MIMRNLLVVCIGNICRSPMAAGLLGAALPQCQVTSAGLGALVGQPADPIACALMAERAVPIDAHRAQQLLPQMCRSADLILVMDTAQRRAVERLHPPSSGKVFRLAEHRQHDIEDPYRRGREAFEAALAWIEDGAGHWVQRIKRVASQ